MIDRQHIGTISIPITEVVLRRASRLRFGNAEREQLVDSALDMEPELVVDLRRMRTASRVGGAEDSSESGNARHG